jgi:hypothetical protein
MDEIKMDEIHHKETLFNETFQMNLFLETFILKTMACSFSKVY